MTADFRWFRDGASGFSGQLLFDEPLARHTYYRIGGPAALVAVPRSLADLAWLADGLRATGAPLFVLGAGSNLLVADAGFAGVVVKTARLNLEIEAAAIGVAAPVAASAGEGAIRLRTGASVAVSTLLRRAAQEGWAGLEFLTGIPGSIGGVVCMNGGTHLGEAKDRLRRVEVFPLLGGRRGGDPAAALTAFAGDALRFEYRRNLFLPSGAVVWAAEWDVSPGEPAQVKAVIDETLARRKSTQPLDFPSCGSVFKNPREHGLHAWQVIEKLGLRGHRVGDAQFSDKHCNFIVNLGQATAADVAGLITLAKARAKTELGIQLEEEVRYLP